MLRFRSRLLAALAILIGAVTSSCATPPRATGDAHTQVATLFRAWVEAFEKRDIEALMSNYDPRVVYSMQGEPDQDFTAIRAGFQQDFASSRPLTRWQPSIDEIHAEGNLVIVFSHWKEMDAHGTGFPRIRSVDVLKGSPQGLRILRTFNHGL